MKTAVPEGFVGAVLRQVLVIRLALLLVAVASDWLVRDYDQSEVALKCGELFSGGDIGVLSMDCMVRRLLGGLGVWDAVYFRGLAERGGYLFEQELAFQPLLPTGLFWGARLGALLSRCVPLSPAAWGLIAGALISLVSSFIAARELLLLTLHFFPDPHFARRVALLFAWSPAGVFLAAIYTEAPFAALSLLSLRLLLASRRPFAASLALTLAGLLRANAFLLAPFFLARAWLVHPWPRRAAALPLWVPAILQAALPFLPFVALQLAAAAWFCPSRPWCLSWPIPAPYAFVQAFYWGNGLFSYWQVKQIPNFIAAAPMLLFSLWNVGLYLSRFFATASRSRNLAVWGFSSASTITSTTTSPSTIRTHLSSPLLLPFFLYWLLLTLVCFFAMHVQVMTRFLSAIPCIYWCAASHPKGSFMGRLILIYFVAYNLIGAILFPNFYPWT